MIRIFFILLTGFFSSPGWADDCDRLPKPSVTLKRLDEPITLNTKLGYKTLSSLAKGISRPSHQVLGLTRGNAIVRFGMNTSSYIDRTKRWECTSPQLTVTIGFSPITVYIAKEFPQESCAYKEIYSHELRHVKAYQTHVAEIEKDIVETLNSRFATGAPWRGPIGQIGEMLQRELDERWLPYIQRKMNRVDSLQALIDTDEEYARLKNACDGEIKTRIQ